MAKGIIILFVLTCVSLLLPEFAVCQNIDPLLFPKDNFTVETRIVKTSAGERNVTYRSYMHIPYVAKPIDKDYQSLNVSVPVKIDEKPVDAQNAPILFVIGVGGYMSSNNARTGSGTGGLGGPGGQGGVLPIQQGSVVLGKSLVRWGFQHWNGRWVGGREAPCRRPDAPDASHLGAYSPVVHFPGGQVSCGGVRAAGGAHFPDYSAKGAAF